MIAADDTFCDRYFRLFGKLFIACLMPLPAILACDQGRRRWTRSLSLWLFDMRDFIFISILNKFYKGFFYSSDYLTLLRLDLGPVSRGSNMGDSTVLNIIIYDFPQSL